MKRAIHIVNFLNYYGLYFDLRISRTEYVRIRLF